VTFPLLAKSHRVAGTRAYDQRTRDATDSLSVAISELLTLENISEVMMVNTAREEQHRLML
jgi:hypothetical protein